MFIPLIINLLYFKLNTQYINHPKINNQHNKLHIINISLSLIPTLLIPIAVNTFLIPRNLGDRRSIPLSLILNYTLPISPPLTSFIINPILIILPCK
ncbi:YitT family protein, partial [Staphylococcus epidermidis]|uniref:YitT family protein n=1 Tax=Staphylococcus epidermidis TaxID=1282 RepID=UPI0037D9E8A0